MGYGTSELPHTGFDVWVPILFGVVLIVSALCLYIAGRRA